MILREKKVRGYFFWAIGVPIKVTNFQKILKKHHTGQFHKKDTILHQACKSHFFYFDLPCM